MTKIKALLNKLRKYIPTRVELIWAHFDPKLKSTVLTGVVGWIITKYGIKLDADVAFYISGAIASITGYTIPNDASPKKAKELTGGNPSKEKLEAAPVDTGVPEVIGEEVGDPERDGLAVPEGPADVEA